MIRALALAALLPDLSAVVSASGCTKHPPAPTPAVQTSDGEGRSRAVKELPAAPAVE